MLDDVIRINRRASELGMTYGAYIASHIDNELINSSKDKCIKKINSEKNSTKIIEEKK